MRPGSLSLRMALAARRPNVTALKDRVLFGCHATNQSAAGSTAWDCLQVIAVLPVLGHMGRFVPKRKIEQAADVNCLPVGCLLFKSTCQPARHGSKMSLQSEA